MSSVQDYLAIKMKYYRNNFARRNLVSELKQKLFSGGKSN